MFTTSKDPEVFYQVTDFELNSIMDVVDNCDTANVLNYKSLLIGDLVSTNKHNLVTVVDSYHRRTHYDVARISFKNDEGNIIEKFTRSSVLLFLSS